MKNFSEATGTKSDLQISLYLRPIGNPCVRIMISGQTMFDGVVESELHLEHVHALLTPIEFSIELRDKKYSLEHETAIVVDRILVDGISIIPELTHLFHYENDHNFGDPTCYLGFNGIWQLDTRDCFYRWWHQQSGQGWLLEPTQVSL